MANELAQALPLETLYRDFPLPHGLPWQIPMTKAEAVSASEATKLEWRKFAHKGTWYSDEYQPYCGRCRAMPRTYAMKYGHGCVCGNEFSFAGVAFYDGNKMLSRYAKRALIVCPDDKLEERASRIRKYLAGKKLTALHDFTLPLSETLQILVDQLGIDDRVLVLVARNTPDALGVATVVPDATNHPWLSKGATVVSTDDEGIVP